MSGKSSSSWRRSKALLSNVRGHIRFSAKGHRGAGREKGMTSEQESRLQGVMLASSFACESKNEQKVVNAMSSLAEQFPGLVFDLQTMSFHDPAKNRTLSIKALVTPKYKYLKQSDPAYKNIFSAVSRLLNIKKETLQKMNADILAEIEADLDAAAEKRASKKEGFYLDVEYNMDLIRGTRDIDWKYALYISDDPVDIFAKSTGEPWEKISCERWVTNWKNLRNTFHAGVYSDIEHGNAVAFVIDKKTGQRVARVMLRNAVDKNNVTTIGIEPIFYSVRGKINTTSHSMIAPGLDAREAYTALVEAISNDGVDMSYIEDAGGKARTPYKYEGYSDRMQAGHVEIAYGNMQYDFTKELDWSNTTEFARCPNCSLHVGWTIEFYVEEGVELEDVITFFETVSDEIVDDFYVPSKVDIEYANIYADYEGETRRRVRRHGDTIRVKTDDDPLAYLEDCPKCGWTLYSDGGGYWSLVDFLRDYDDEYSNRSDAIEYIDNELDWHDCEKYLIVHSKSIDKDSEWYSRAHGDDAPVGETDIYAIDTSEDGVKRIWKALDEYIDEHVDGSDLAAWKGTLAGAN